MAHGASAVDAQYNYDIVKKFAIMAMIWGVLGMIAGTYIAAELAFPFLNFDTPQITFGQAVLLPLDERIGSQRDETDARCTARGITQTG